VVAEIDVAVVVTVERLSGAYIKRYLRIKLKVDK
jgi:hypothetical protein